MDKTMKDVARANDRQVGGTHYQSSTGVQHWDIVVQEGWDYLTGCATKYLWRWRKKNGLQDLLKARHYLDKLIEIEEERLKNGGTTISDGGGQTVSYKVQVDTSGFIPGPVQCKDLSY